MKRKTITVLAGLLLFGTLAGFICWTWPQDKPLLAHARKVAAVPGVSGASQWYAWKSDHEALVFSNENFTEGKKSLVSYDVRTGRAVPLAGWTRCLDERQDKYNSEFISPDGQWLLYTDYYEDGVSAADASGRNPIRWHSPLWNGGQRRDNKGDYMGWDGIHWLPDSRHWVQPEFDHAGIHAICLVVRSVDAPHSIRRIPIPPASRPLFNEEYEQVYLSEQHIVQVRFTAPWLLTDPQAALETWETDLSRQDPPRVRTIAFPPGWDVREVVLSPKGDRLAWFACVRPVSFINTILRRLHLPSGDDPMSAIYVSGIDGHNMHEIGHAPSLDDSNGLSEIQWLPGGTQLSFVYDDDLYTVPAD